MKIIGMKDQSDPTKTIKNNYILMNKEEVN